SFNRSSTLQERAIYLQDYISVGEKLKIFAGLRYTDAEGNFTLTSGPRSGSDTALDYTAGAVYNFQPEFNPFFSYSTALTPQTGAQSGSGDAVPFREGEQIEVGLKSEWLGGQLATTASVFQIEQTNISEGDPANPGFFILAGDQRTRGFEFEAVGKVTDQFSVLGGYSYLDAEFTAGTNEGNRPHSVPKHKVSLFGQYEFAGELAGWRTGLGFVHVGARQGNNANTFKLPTYERVDAFIGYERGGFDFRLAIENVLNEDYIIGADAGGNFAQGAPRFFTLTVGCEF
ncbi:MAG: TonB-dependent receptor, partial [Hyphomicrobiales bacterium]|nr:TonB-dependent receptor [Hyphomicrobiales bacterium]